MSAMTEAVYKRMSQDSALVSMLPRYHGQPTIFTAEPVPPDAPLPLIITAGQVSDITDVPEHSKQRVGSRPVRDIRVFGDATGSMRQVECIADRVWELFHKYDLQVTGWETVRCRATRPFFAVADGRVYGLVVTLNLALNKEV